MVAPGHIDGQSASGADAFNVAVLSVCRQGGLRGAKQDCARQRLCHGTVHVDIAGRAIALNVAVFGRTDQLARLRILDQSR